MPIRFILRDIRVRSIAVPLLLLMSYGVIAYALLISNGMYLLRALAWIGIGWVMLVVAGMFFRMESGHLHVSKVIIRVACVVMILLSLLVAFPVTPGIYLHSLAFAERFQALSFLLGLLTLIMLGISFTRFPRWISRGLFIVCLAFFASLYFGMLRASPSPVIDVFSMLRDSSTSLLHGLNPYTTPFVDPYGGNDNSWTTAVTLVYPPITLLPAVVGRMLTGDVRLLNAVSILFVGLFLWWVVRRKDETTGQLLCLLWLAHPRGLFVLEQSWVDPGALAVLCIALLLLRPGFLRSAAATFGLFVSFKQYLVLAMFPALRITRSLRSLLWFLLPAVLIALPFFIWDPAAFIQNAILFQIKTAFRADSLTLAAYLFNEHSILLGKWWTLVIGFGVSGLTFLLPSIHQRTTLVFSFAIIFLSLFFLGTQGFCNYYYFACGLILMTLALMIGEEVEVG